MASWQAVDRQYSTAYPGHGRVVEYLLSHQKVADARVADTDPNPDLMAKRRANLGRIGVPDPAKLRRDDPGQRQSAA